MYSIDEEHPKPKPEGNSEAFPEFYIGPKKDKYRYKYTVSGIEHLEYPVFRAADKKAAKDTLWVFRSVDPSDEFDGFQCNWGEEFASSEPCFRTLDYPWFPGNHEWSQFIPGKGTRKGRWQPFGDWQTTPASTTQEGAATTVPVSSATSQWPEGRWGEPSRVVAVDDLRYSQKGISQYFSDSRPLSVLIEKLNNWETDPMQADFLILGSHEIDGELYAAENRRLYCLKAHQEAVRDSGWKVFVRLDPVVPIEHRLTIRVMMRELKETNWGKRVNLRYSPQR